MSDDPATTFFPEVDEIPSLYEVLSVDKDATAEELKKAYRRLSLLHHPDKVAATATSDDERAAATLKFQQIGFAYTVLKDEARRERYDRTGSTAEVGGEGAKTEAEWRDYFAELWSGEVSASSIEEFKAKYQGSDEEKGDVLTAYTSSSGDVDAILSSVMCSSVEDEERFTTLINTAIAAGEVKATPAWKKALKDSKGKERRRKKAQSEAAEAEELAKELGVHDKLYGGAKKGGKGKGKKAAEDDDPDAALRALIQAKNQNKMSSLIDSLEARYGGGSSSKKGKKRASTSGEEGSKGGKKKRVEEEPSEEAFAAAQAKVDARRKGGKK